MANCFCLKWRPDIVRVLDFRHCNLLFVPEEVFEFGETLEELFLDSNDIRDLPRPLFHCQLLKKLGASDNELFSIPPAVASLINLKELDISKNGIVELPDAIKGCKELELMEASVNPLGRLPDGFTQLINLTQLYLNDTLLDFLPANFGRMVKLKVLELRENHLKSLPKSIARLTELERLDLGQNCFQEIPDVIGLLSSLQEFWIDSNRVNTVPESIGGLSKLFYFDASRNRIEELPSSISGWDAIKDIHLSKNFIQDLPVSIGELSTLSTLRIDNNQLSSLPYSIGGLVSLEELILNANDLEDVPPSIGLLRRLRHLNVDDNMIMALPTELGSCNKISLLSVRGNYLEWLPDEIGRISSLAVANFSNNRLKYLPYNFTKLKNLQALWLSENQSKPLIPLQSEFREESGKRVLTCFLLPQLPPDDIEYDDDGSDSESFHMSVWSQQRRQKMVIAFDVSESEPETVFEAQNRKQAYPKETYRPKFRGGPNSQLANGHAGFVFKKQDEPVSGQRQRVRGRRELAEEGSTTGSVRSSRPRSPASSTISATHSLFKADKEKHAKDKERIRRGSLSPDKGTGTGKGELSVQWELPESTPKEQKKRRSNRIIIKERNAHSDTEVLDSHPMRVRTPRSERRRRGRHVKHHMDEADREVAQLTNSFRDSSPERDNQTDTELFTKKDMPDVVFQQKVLKQGLVTSSTSGATTRTVSSSRGEESRNKRTNRYLPNERESHRSSPIQGYGSVNSNTGIPAGHRPSVPSREVIANGGIPNRRQRSLPVTPKPHAANPSSKYRTPDGPGRRETRMMDSSRDGDPKVDYVATPVQHHVMQQQGRDSGISVQQSPSGFVTDPELERLYQMRYIRGTTGHDLGYSTERDNQERGETMSNSSRPMVNRTRPSHSTYDRTDSENYQGSPVRARGKENAGESRNRRRVEENQNQEWRYNVKTEATSRVTIPRNVDCSNHHNKKWQHPHQTSTPLRNEQSSVNVDLSNSNQRYMTSRTPTGRNDSRPEGDPHERTVLRSTPTSKPWDPSHSPYRPQTDSNAGVPASTEYSDQLRRVSGQFLSTAGSYHSKGRTFSNTPSISYQQPPSLEGGTGGKGARRHLRFSSENQSLNHGDHHGDNRAAIIQSEDNRSNNSFHSRTPLPNRTGKPVQTETRDSEDEGTFRDTSQGHPSHLRNYTDSLERTLVEGDKPNPSSQFNASSDGPFQERAVDVPPEFMDDVVGQQKQDRISQKEIPSGSQWSRTQPYHSTPYNPHISSLSSGQPFSSPRQPASTLEDYRREPVEESFAAFQNDGTRRERTVSPQVPDIVQEDVQWALPTWDHEGNGQYGSYSTDINRNRSYAPKWPDHNKTASAQEQGWKEGNRNNSNLTKSVEQREVMPDLSNPAERKLPASGDINELNWKNHLLDHLQKKSKNQDESDDVFQVSGPSPSPPSYHKAISNSYPMPPFVTRRSLPMPPQASQSGKDGEDMRRVTPPGSSGSSTTGSFQRHVLPPYNAKSTRKAYQARREPPSYHSSPAAQRRTAPDGNRGQWL